MVLIAENCFGYSGSFVSPYELMTDFSSSVKNDVGILIGIALIL